MEQEPNNGGNFITNITNAAKGTARFVWNLLKARGKYAIIVIIIFLILILSISAIIKITIQISSEEGKRISKSAQIADDNSYIITDEDVAALRQLIEDMGYKIKDFNMAGELKNDEDREDPESIKKQNAYLKKYLEAYVATTHLKIGEKTGIQGVQGVIEVKRADASGSVRSLTYMKYEEFAEKVEAGEILKDNFSIDEDDFLCVVGWETLTINGELQDSAPKIIRLDYSQMTQKYATPLTFLLSLNIITKNPEFVMEFVDRALEETQIVITIQDTTENNTMEEVYKYDGTRTVTSLEYKYDNTGRVIDTKEVTNTYDAGNGEGEKTATVRETVSAQANVTLADIWIAKYVIAYELITETDGPNTSSTPLDDETINNPKSDGVVMDETHLYNRKIEKTETTTKSTWKKMAEMGENGKAETKEEEIIALFDQDFAVPYMDMDSRPGKKLLDSTVMLLDLLDSNEETQFHSMVMKYLLYVYDNREYLTDEELEELRNQFVDDVSEYLDPEEIINVTEIEEQYGEDSYETGSYTGDDSLLIRFIKSYENTDLWPPEKTGKYLTADKQRYIAYKEVLDSGKITYNFAWGVNVTGGNHQALFTKYGYTGKVADVREGDEISKEIVDKVFYDMINGWRQEVASQLPELKQCHQIDALTDVKYNDGSISVFLNTTYPKYKNNLDALGDNYYPFNRNTRGKNRWTMFSEGIYVGGYGLFKDKCSCVGGSTGGTDGTGETTQGSGQGTSATGNGYSSVYEINGKKYKEYKQFNGAYITATYGNDSCDPKKSGHVGGPHIHNNGCGPTSVAIIASGYGQSVDPGDVAKRMGGQGTKSSSTTMGDALRSYGISCRNVGTMSEVIQHVKTGKPAIISVNGNEREWLTKKDGGHIVTILDYKNDKGTEKVYMSNPGSSVSSKDGWVSLQKLSNCFSGRCGLLID